MLDDPDLVPMFGCMPHTPDRVAPERIKLVRKGRAPAPCPVCGGHGVDYPFVCAACHSVDDSLQIRLDASKVSAIASREPQRNLMLIAAHEKKGSRAVFTDAERRELVRDYPDTAPAFLDSIGQPPCDDATIAAVA